MFFTNKLDFAATESDGCSWRRDSNVPNISRKTACLVALSKCKFRTMSLVAISNCKCRTVCLAAISKVQVQDRMFCCSLQVQVQDRMFAAISKCKCRTRCLLNLQVQVQTGCLAAISTCKCRFNLQNLDNCNDYNFDTQRPVSVQSLANLASWPRFSPRRVRLRSASLHFLDNSFAKILHCYLDTSTVSRGP